LRLPALSDCCSLCIDPNNANRVFSAGCSEIHAIEDGKVSLVARSEPGFNISLVTALVCAADQPILYFADAHGNYISSVHLNTHALAALANVVTPMAMCGNGNLPLKKAEFLFVLTTNKLDPISRYEVATGTGVSVVMRFAVLFYFDVSVYACLMTGHLSVLHVFDHENRVFDLRRARALEYSDGFLVVVLAELEGMTIAVIDVSTGIAKKPKQYNSKPDDGGDSRYFFETVDPIDMAILRDERVAAIADVGKNCIRMIPLPDYLFCPRARAEEAAAAATAAVVTAVQ
jgi:hypothetical protein